jgi:hypothetical protein
MRLLIVCIATLYTGSLNAEPKYQFTEGAVMVLLDSDKCSLDAISNLPFKAQWIENGKTLEGCWKPNPQVGAIDFYFSDKTSFSMPAQLFRKVVGV